LLVVKGGAIQFVGMDKFREMETGVRGGLSKYCGDAENGGKDSPEKGRFQAFKNSLLVFQKISYIHDRYL